MGENGRGRRSLLSAPLLLLIAQVCCACRGRAGEDAGYSWFCWQPEDDAGSSCGNGAFLLKLKVLDAVGRALDAASLRGESFGRWSVVLEVP